MIPSRRGRNDVAAEESKHDEAPPHPRSLEHCWARLQMSYDLFLGCRGGDYDPDRFKRYFRGREFYQIEANEAVYDNKDTGVCFSFRLDEHALAPRTEGLPIVFNVNFLRPSYFILEAEPEVTALVRNFDLIAFDPQDHGIQGEEYDRTALIAGWNHGNEFAYSAILGDPGKRRTLFSLPSEELTRIWAWNKNVKTMQTFVGDSKFVPRIFFVQTGQDVTTAIVWGDGIPIVIPQVDYLIVARKELAPRPLPNDAADETLLAWNDAHSFFQTVDVKRLGEAIVLDYDQPPAHVMNFVRSLPSQDSELKGIHPACVLDRELVEKYVR
jgi:hypothetical protein